MKKFGEILGIIIFVPLICVFIALIGMYVLAILGIMLLMVLVVVAADMPITVTKDDKKVGTWRRSTGYVPDKTE
jgi:hypothetical protein